MQANSERGVPISQIIAGFASGMRERGAAAILDVAFAHPIKLIVNALGVPPRVMLERARAETYDYLVNLRDRMREHIDAAGDMIGADEAARLGLVEMVVPHEELRARTLELAGRIAVTP